MKATPDGLTCDNKNTYLEIPITVPVNRFVVLEEVIKEKPKIIPPFRAKHHKHLLPGKTS